MEKTSLGHTPTGRWRFDGAVTDCFEDMLRRSIPQYDAMRASVLELSLEFLRPRSWVVDLGCSRGESIVQLMARCSPSVRFLGVECSMAMVRAARNRLRSEIQSGRVEIEKRDLRRSYPHVNAGVTLSVLTLQFTPIEYRQRIFREIYEHTAPGGTFILVEKILGADAELDAVMVDAYYRMKRANGYSQDEINKKRTALEGVLVPVTARWNDDFLRTVGFRHVDCFWRWMNFAGWIAIK